MFRFFESRLDPFPETLPTRPPSTLLAFCRHYTSGAWRPIVLMAVLTSVIAVAEVALFSFLGDIVTWLTTHGRADLLKERGTTLISIGVGVVLVLPTVALLHNLLLHQTLLGNYPMRIRWNVHRYLLGQSMAYFQNEFAGRVATKLMQTALAVRESVLKVLDVLNYVTVYFTGAVIIVGGFHRLLVLPFVVWLVIYVLVLRHFIPRLQRVSEQQADARSTMTGRIVDSYTNISTVKLFSHSKREESYAKQSMEGFLATVYRQMRLVTGLWMLIYTMNALLLTAVGTVAVRLWISGDVEVGAVAVAISLVVRLWGMSQWIMWEVSNLFENIGTMEDGMGSIARDQTVRDLPDATKLSVSRGEIRFRNVSFSYGEKGRVFDSLDLVVAPGERVGIVGRSGAGKSTLVNLLLRFHDLEAGSVEIDGQNICQVTQESLRENIGVVTQDTSLLHRSVRENIMYGRPDATDEDVREAAQKAACDEFILRLKDEKGRSGYDAHVGERGVTLSGGQRQRIAVARVILKAAPILILDEATSALDSEVEAVIQENLDALMADRTVLAIAHRLSTIAALDRLIVLDEGRILEQGTHRELLAKRGLYHRLWEHQSGGFLGNDDENAA